MGNTFCGCWLQVSQVPSSSDTRNRLSMNSADSFALSPGTGLGTGLAGFGRGPGSCALPCPAGHWAIESSAYEFAHAENSSKLARPMRTRVSKNLPMDNAILLFDW